MQHPHRIHTHTNQALKSLLIWITILTSTVAYGATHHMPRPIQLETIRIKSSDKAAITRGATFFAQHCLSCHSLKYLRFDPIAKAAGITIDRMPVKNQQWSYGMPPPDLTLIAKVRGTRWLYTYLLTFYEDKSQPTHANNLIMPNTSMPNPFIGLQGTQKLVIKKQQLMHPPTRPIPRWFNLLKLKQQGQLTPHAFDQTVQDLVAFLAYAAEPSKVQRQRIGWWVLGFLLIFAVLTYCLKTVYWKPINKRRQTQPQEPTKKPE